MTAINLCACKGQLKIFNAMIIFLSMSIYTTLDISDLHVIFKFLWLCNYTICIYMINSFINDTVDCNGGKKKCCAAM